MSNLAAHPSQLAISHARPTTVLKNTVRLTPRGRLVVLVAALALAGSTIGLGQAVIATSQIGVEAPTQSVVVQPGETLWDIAARVHPGGYIRDTVAEIADLNALDNPAGLQMGSTILVPIYDTPER